MDLLSALESTDGTICVVGGGGKKTTLYSLASRLENAVVTSTVRIPIFDGQVRHVEVTEDPVGYLERADDVDFPIGLVPEREREDRYRGYDPETVDDLAAAHDGPILVKADGARTRDFKAPAGNEPQLPSTADVVIPVASVHVVGKPLTEEWVHRPERVAALTDIDEGEEITTDVVATVIASDEGGAKDVPTEAILIPLLTKVDGPEHERAAREIAKKIHERIDVPRVALARFEAFDAI